MYQEERIQKIYHLLGQKQTLSKQEIMETFNISQDTARRDILAVLKFPGVVRTHGGIMLTNETSQVLSYFSRSQLLTKEKEQMARRINTLIPEQAICYFDVSTTICLACKSLDKPCSIYTHSLDNAFVLAQNPKISLHMLGGSFDFENRYFYSEAQLNQLATLRFDYAFIGTASLDALGALNKEENNARLKRQIVTQARKVILVAENQKFKKQSTHLGVSYDQIDIFLTDCQPTKEQRKLFNPKTEILI